LEIIGMITSVRSVSSGEKPGSGNDSQDVHS